MSEPRRQYMNDYDAHMICRRIGCSAADICCGKSFCSCSTWHNQARWMMRKKYRRTSVPVLVYYQDMQNRPALLVKVT